MYISEAIIAKRIMFNFANKAASRESKVLIVNFPSLWRQIDDTYFNLSVPSIQALYKEVVTPSEYTLKALENKEEEKKEERKSKKKRKQKEIENKHKTETKPNTLLGYSVQSIPKEETKQTLNELEYEIQNIKTCINQYQYFNEQLVAALTQCIEHESITTSNKFTKETQAFFIDKEISKLEYKQIAESIISIFKCNKSSNEFEVLLDASMQLSSIRLNLEQVKLLSKHREGMFNTSPYDSSKLVARHFICKDDDVDEMPMEQIANLLDVKVIGRVIPSSTYNICHHCKEIQPIRRLLKCKKSVATVIAKPVVGKRKKGRRSVHNYRETKKMDLTKPCERMFCFGCIYLNYDQELSVALNDSSWTCPYCQVVSY
jgi:hypothetical protein